MQQRYPQTDSPGVRPVRGLCLDEDGCSFGKDALIGSYGLRKASIPKEQRYFILHKRFIQYYNAISHEAMAFIKELLGEMNEH